MAQKQIVGRIMFRVEGDNWNAYYGLPDSMKDALFLGSIKLAIVHDPKRKAAFMQIMQSFVSELMPQVATWKTQRAPESEKTKE